MTFRINFTAAASSDVQSTHHPETHKRGAYWSHILAGAEVSGSKIHGFYYDLYKELMSVDDDVVPAEIRQYVKSYSVKEYMASCAPTRILGEYRHRSARAVVEHQTSGSYRYAIIAEATEIADLREIVRLIMAGMILPELSYEGRQADPDVATLLTSVLSQRCQALTWQLERAHQVIAGFDRFYANSIAALAAAEATIRKQESTIASLGEEIMGEDA